MTAGDTADRGPPGDAEVRRAISLRLTVLARQLRKEFDQSLDGLGVTRSQWTAIVIVARRPGATQRMIAEALDMSEAAAGRLIDRLCTDGLLERRAKADDKRAYCIFLTDGARPLLERLGGIATSHEEKTFSGISSEELRHFAALLDTIYQNITS